MSHPQETFDPAELANLIVDQLTDQFTQEQQQRLESLLESSPAARMAYLDHIHDAGVMRQVLSTTDAEVEPGRMRRVWTAVYDYISQPVALAMLVSGIVITNGLLVLALISAPEWQHGEELAPREELEFVATVTRTVDAEWSEDSGIKANRMTQLLAGDVIELLEGLAEVRFDSGAVVLLDAPARFVPQASGSGELRRGKLTVRVPTEAIGFTIRTPTMTVVDLGTEFGVEVGEDGSTLTQVIDGLVTVSTQGVDGTVVRELSANEAIRSLVMNSGQTRLVAVKPVKDRFVHTLPAVTIRPAGDGVGYDEADQPAFLSTRVRKLFDVDGDHVYGTAGFLMFGVNDKRSETVGGPFAAHVDRLPAWVSVAAGKNFSSVASGFEKYAAIDHPELSSGANVANWPARSGIALSSEGGASDWLALVHFVIGEGAPERFRLGVMTGNEGSEDGRWDPAGVRLLGPDGAIAEVTKLPVSQPAGAAGWVFFDIDTDGAPRGLFLIQAQKRLATQGPSIGGLTFDVPVAIPNKENLQPSTRAIETDE